MSNEKTLSYPISPQTESHCNILANVLPEVCMSVCICAVRDRERKGAAGKINEFLLLKSGIIPQIHFNTLLFTFVISVNIFFNASRPTSTMKFFYSSKKVFENIFK